MGMLKIIELHAFDDETLVQKFDMKDNVIKKGSSLTVRESQVAVFCDKGKTADVFGAGTMIFASPNFAEESEYFNIASICLPKAATSLLLSEPPKFTFRFTVASGVVYM